MPNLPIRGISTLALCLAILLTSIATAAPTTPSVEQANLVHRIDALGVAGLDQLPAAAEAVAVSADPRVVPILRALADGDLYVVQPAGAVVLLETDSAGNRVALHALTGDHVSLAEPATVERIRVNNRVRRELSGLVGSLTLFSPQVSERKRALDDMLKRRDPSTLPILERAALKEVDPDIRTSLTYAIAVIRLSDPNSLQTTDALTAVNTVADRANSEALSLLAPLSRNNDAVGLAARKAVSHIETQVVLWNAAQNVVYGLSLGSVLLLAATGLAITFGVMGVINMAHGEMVMLGAYTTYGVQELVRVFLPAFSDYALLLALPAVFLVTATIGVLIERCVIRWLYGRPLETLLATWGVSLALQQVIRVLFGASNREVTNPTWMSGSIALGQLNITSARLWIIGFALVVFASLLLFIRRSQFGLRMRAVTQHRSMAGVMGIHTPSVDMLTFGLGSGIAGIAGLALSQIDNVSPNLGRGYIIDSFMVVVFGGVGNLWGTLVGAFSLGIANKLIEPYAGAVLGKIAVLVFIILFIQKRPRGLFALKGRMVEA